MDCVLPARPLWLPDGSPPSIPVAGRWSGHFELESGRCRRQSWLGMIFQYTLDKVLDGRKTQTRRLVIAGKPPRWRAGSTYAIQPGRIKKSVARIEVTGVTKEPLGKINEAGARAEGSKSLAEFKKAWAEIHGGYDPKVEVWVISFRLVAAARAGRRRRRR